MWHQFTLHALTYCRLCKDADPCRAPLMVPEPRLRYGQSGLKAATSRVPQSGSILIIRSYQGESTGSHPNSEVKHPWACSVLRWGTTRESQVTNVFVLVRGLQIWKKYTAITLDWMHSSFRKGIFLSHRGGKLMILRTVGCETKGSLYCEPPAAPGGTAIPGPRPDMVQAPEARHGIKIRLINWMVYDHRIRD